MAKYRRRSLRGILRTWRWWGITYGSFKPFKKSCWLWWFRSPPCSVWVFLIGLAVGAYIVWKIPCY